MMKEDLDFLVKDLEEIHPATLNGFTDEQKNLIEETYERINEPLEDSQFYFLINQIVTSFNDAHTKLSYKSTEWLNMPIVWLEEGIIISDDYEEFKKGDKVISIGDKTEQDLFSELENIISADNKYTIMDRASDSLIKGEVLRYLKLVDGNNVKLKLDRQGKIIDLRIPLENEYKLNDNSRYWIGWDIDKENSLGTFYFDKSIFSEEYIKELEGFLKEVHSNSIENIVVDLRNNTGGTSENTNAFIKYMDIPCYDDMGTGIRFSRQSTQLLNKYVDGVPNNNPIKLDNLEFGYSNTKPELRIGYWLYWNDSKINILNADDKYVKNWDLVGKYNGNIFILTSNKTFSAGNWFATLFKDNNLATIIG